MNKSPCTDNYDTNSSHLKLSDRFNDKQHDPISPTDGNNCNSLPTVTSLDTFLINHSPIDYNLNYSNDIHKLRDTLKVLSLNCCSLRSLGKRARFQAMVDEYRPDIILGCESHLDESYTTTEVFPQGYTIIRKDRCLGGGGVFLAVASDLPFLDVSVNTNTEMIWGKISPIYGETLFICSFYRPPGGDIRTMEEFKSAFLSLGLAVNLNSNVIIAGDFNFPSIVWEDGIGYTEANPTYGTEINSIFLDIINEFGLEQQVSEHTRGNHTLDIVLSSQPHTINSVTTIPGMSDHEAVLFDVLTKLKRHRLEPRKIYQYHKADKEVIIAEVHKFVEVFFKGTPYVRSIHENWHLLQASLVNIIDKYVPSKVIRPHKDVPWLNNFIKRKMKSRNKLYIRAKCTQNESDWTAYRQLRNEINNLMKESYHNYCQHLFDDSYSDNRKRFWSLIKSLQKDYSSIVSLNVNGKCITDPQDKAEALNDQFFTFFTDENDSIPNPDFIHYPQIGDLYFSTEGITNLMNKLPIYKSAGPDNIPNFILKVCSTVIAPVLQVIFTQSLMNHTLPTEWLSANIVPIFKKGSRNLGCNYRPISLTSSCCKLMEHIIFRFIMDHLDRNNIINKNQHGFRRAHSCQSQLLLLTEDVLKAMDNKKQVDIVLLDFCKAFDKVPHKRLLCKLKSYGIQGDLVEWIEHWLTKRNQRVILENHASNKVPVKSGVPQGTVLGPLMFLLYINDISNNISSTIRLFADDCIIYRIIDTENDSQTLQRDLDIISCWTETWQMQLNIDKCAIVRCTRSPLSIKFDYKLNDTYIRTVHQHQYLGITIDESMHWSHHIKSICQKANKTLNFIRRNLYKCDGSVKASAYLTIVRPLLEYAACVWDPHQVYLIHDIEKVQRRAARWVLSDYNYNSSVTLMLRSLRWTSLEHRRRINRLSQFHKIVHHLTPAIQMPPYYLTTYYPTRKLHHCHFITPATSTTAYQQSFFPKTLKEWNNLPINIIEASTTKQFMTALLNQYSSQL